MIHCKHKSKHVKPGAMSDGINSGYIMVFDEATYSLLCFVAMLCVLQHT